MSNAVAARSPFVGRLCGEDRGCLQGCLLSGEVREAFVDEDVGEWRAAVERTDELFGFASVEEVGRVQALG